MILFNSGATIMARVTETQKVAKNMFHGKSSSYKNN